jgi:hypothetical protein
MLTLTGHERFNTHLMVENGLGFDPIYGLGATPRKAAMALGNESDVPVMTDATIGRESPYPLNTAIKELLERFVVVGDTEPSIGLYDDRRNPVPRFRPAFELIRQPILSKAVTV